MSNRAYRIVGRSTISGDSHEGEVWDRVRLRWIPLKSTSTVVSEPIESDEIIHLPLLKDVSEDPIPYGYKLIYKERFGRVLLKPC